MKHEHVRDWMSTNVITVEPTAKLPEVHKLMKNKGIRRLPVVQDGKLVGLVTIGDVREAEPSTATTLSIWEINYLIAKLEVREFMSRDVLKIAADATIEEAAQKMLDYRISGLPVVDDNDKLVGIITESDIFSMVVQHGWESELVQRDS